MKRTLFRFAALTGCCFLIAGLSISAQERNRQAFEFVGGQYEMRATYKFSDQEDPVVNAGGSVTVTIKDDEISISVPLSPVPIIARITGDSFKGQLQNDGASVEFQGEIVENNHVEGVFIGNFGKRKVNGLWTMKLAKKKQDKVST